MRPARRSSLAVAVTAVALLAASCGDDDGLVCVSTEVGEVCADNADGGIAFSGRGLDPQSEVTIQADQVGPILYGVGADGELDADASGVLSFVADTEFTFDVFAVDADGTPVRGIIVIRS